MSQKIIQLLKSNDALRSAHTPGTDSGFKIAEIKRVPYNKKNMASYSTAKKSTRITTVPKCQVNLIVGGANLADRYTPQKTSSNLASPIPTRKLSNRPQY